MAKKLRYHEATEVRSDKLPQLPKSILRPCRTVQRWTGFPPIFHYVTYKGYVKIYEERFTYYVMYAKCPAVFANKKVSPEDAGALVALYKLKPHADCHEVLFKNIGILEPWPDGNDPLEYRINMDKYRRLTEGFALVIWDDSMACFDQNALCTCRLL